MQESSVRIVSTANNEHNTFRIRKSPCFLPLNLVVHPTEKDAAKYDSCFILGKKEVGSVSLVAFREEVMGELIFWGDKGEYGPFTMQEDGWPNAGEVIRLYRRKGGMSAEILAKQYGEAIGTQVTARWILKMEQQNKIPTDIQRRRVLVKLLEIPPLLLGLASLEQAVNTLTKHVHAPSTLKYASFDLEHSTEDIHLFWKLHYAQTAQDALGNILTDIETLLPLQKQAKGSLLRYLNELLTSYYRLAATIQRDRGNFSAAYTLANESVRMAKAMGNDPYALHVTAASLYTRGVVNLAWGAFGTQVKQGTVLLEKDKLVAAFSDFERALHHASPQLKGILYSEMARTKALTMQSLSDVTIALTLIEHAEDFVDVDSNDDFYTQILVNGDLKGLDKRRLILSRAKTFLAIRRPAKAREELTELEILNDGTSHTRRRGWTHILFAQASLDLGDDATALQETMSAFTDCMEAHSVTHLARINELHTRLLTTSQKDTSDVKRLGRLLQKEFPLSGRGEPD